MSSARPSYPTPLANDPETVQHALQAGVSEWEHGDVRAAVRWVHRAADAAEAAGDDRRAVSLAGLAADLISSLNLPHSTAPISDEASALAPYDDFNDATIVDSPANVAVRRDRGSNSKLRAAQPSPLIVEHKSRTALRVAARRGDDGEISVRILPEGTLAPAGAIEALLVLLDPEAHL